VSRVLASGQANDRRNLVVLGMERESEKVSVSHSLAVKGIVGAEEDSSQLVGRSLGVEGEECSHNSAQEGREMEVLVAHSLAAEDIAGGEGGIGVGEVGCSSVADGPRHCSNRRSTSLLKNFCW